MKILMITGSAGVGKDTYAAEVIESVDEPVMTLAFADPIKEDLTRRGWDGQKDEAGRTLLQKYGEIWNEYVNQKGLTPLWAGVLVDRITLWRMMGYNYFIITDLRYNHEVEWVKKMYPNANIEVVELVRDYQTNLTREQLEHPSEQRISDEHIDFIIENGLRTYELIYSDCSGKIFIHNFKAKNIEEVKAYNRATLEHLPHYIIREVNKNG